MLLSKWLKDFLQKAGPKEYALLEDREAAPYLDRIEKIVLYHWNRSYPGDFSLISM